MNNTNQTPDFSNSENNSIILYSTIGLIILKFIYMYFTDNKNKSFKMKIMNILNEIKETSIIQNDNINNVLKSQNSIK